MRYRRALIPTVKEAPSDANTVSHALLTRAGYIRKMGAGIYSFLPLGVRVLEKIKRIIIEEMDSIGAQQILMPALLPAEYFRESGRWKSFGPELLRLQDRKGADYHLGPTHEEIVTDLARREIHSYRDLPKQLYQVQSKYRDEPRPRAGLLRSREFLMKDAYSFDQDLDYAEHTYRTMRDAYTRIFDKTGLTYRRVTADSGSMGGSRSEEFQVLVHSGEDILVACKGCEYAANAEVAASVLAQAPPAPEVSAPIEEVRVKTDKAGAPKKPEELDEKLGRVASQRFRSELFQVGSETVLAVVCEKYDVNPDKLARLLQVSSVDKLEDGAVRNLQGCSSAFVGPVGFAGRIIMDEAASQVRDAACGGNHPGLFFVNVVAGRDFDVALTGNFRTVEDGDGCIECGGELQRFRGIEAGHIFLLGTHYSEKMGATFLDKNQDKRHLVMGCYGIGVSRLMASAVEQHSDSWGIVWPLSIAPYHVHITQLGDVEQVAAAVAFLEKSLEAQGVEVLVDDRDERPGVKFKDADLIGIPFRLTVGERGLKEGVVEVKARAEKDNSKVALDAVVDMVLAALEKQRVQEQKVAS